MTRLAAGLKYSSYKKDELRPSQPRITDEYPTSLTPAAGSAAPGQSPAVTVTSTRSGAESGVSYSG